MNKFCKSSLCVEKVRESYVLIGRRVVEVPGGVDAIRLAILILISVRLRLCYKLFSLGLGAVPARSAKSIQRDLLEYTVPGTC